MNSTLEILWIRTRTYVSVALMLLGIGLILWGAYEIFGIAFLFSVSPDVVKSINSVLPRLNVVLAFAVALVGFGLTAFTTRQR